MDRLQKLEANGIYVLREAYKNFRDLCMLWSIGKDSTVLLHLARKAFFGHVPFPLVHIDTSFKIPEMIEYRDKMVRKWHLDMIVGQNTTALKNKETYPDGKLNRIQCCMRLKSEALRHTIAGDWPRLRFDHQQDKYIEEKNARPFTGVIVGVRADEEGTRSKERVFSPRNTEGNWNIVEQPPELWNYYNTDFAPGTHVRIHPILEWTELDIWEYIERENIPVVSLYFDNGKGQRYRSLGCAPCTSPIKSSAKNVSEIVKELSTGALKGVAERAGREQDKEDGGTLETLRKDGYM